MTSDYFGKNSRYFIYGFLILAIVVVAFWLISFQGYIEEPEETASPTELVAPLASGKQSYDIITGTPKSFRITEVSVDPIDVGDREIQTVTVWVRDDEDNPITHENSVEGTVVTDNMSTPFTFLLKEVTDDDEGTIMKWEGAWLCEDTYDYAYMISIEAKSLEDEHSVDLSFR